MPKVSVIIPVYNVEKYLRECLDSVVNQTLKDIEIICVDDGSTDNSLNIQREYEQIDTRIKVIDKKNEGAATARNVGLDIAKGEYVAFMDSDDLYPDSNVLEKLYYLAKKHNVYICGGEMEQMKPDGSFITKNQQDTKYNFDNSSIIEYINYQFDYGFTRFIYNRQFLVDNDITFPNYLRQEDPPFFIKAMATAQKFYALAEPTYIYRVSYKKVVWDERKTFDTFRGLEDCLFLCEQNGFNILYSNIFKRINTGNWFAKAVSDTIWSDKVRKQVIKTFTNIDKDILTKHGINMNLHEVYQSIIDCPKYKPAVSVIVPVYNVEKYLSRCLDSIINQTFKNLEIICVNDGSTDGSLKILENYANKDKRIKIISQKNQGLPNARNTGLKEASGRYITFVDSDDWIDLNWLEAMYNAIISSNADIAKSGYKHYYPDEIKEDDINAIIYRAASSNALLNMNDNNIVVWATLYKTDFLKKKNILFFDNDILKHEDILYTLRATFFANKIVPVCDTYYNYRRETSILSSFNYSECSVIPKIHERAITFINNVSINKRDYVIAAKRIIWRTFDTLEKLNEFSEFSDDKFIFLKKIIKFLSQIKYKGETFVDYKDKLIKLNKKYINKYLQRNKADVLIVEYNNCHGECLPGYVNYFLELGYKVDIIISNKLALENPLNMFLDNANVYIDILNENEIIALLNSDRINEYKYCFLNSEIVYSKNKVIFDLIKVSSYKTKFICVCHRFENLKKLDRVSQPVILKSFKKCNNKYAVNPHYFGNVEKHKKNNFINFIVAGNIEKKRKNYDLLINAVERLIKDDITNFKITVIGKGDVLYLPEHIKSFFDVKGRLTYSNMYEELINADFFLTLLDPNNAEHSRYKTLGTSGSFQLINGFLVPAIIEQSFAKVHDYNRTNAIIYENNDNLYDAMKYAINMEEISYLTLQENLEILSNKLHNNSLTNLQKMLKHFSLNRYLYINLKNIFSVRNEGIHKVVTILGLKLKFRSKKLIRRQQGVPELEYSFAERIFSVKNSDIHKIITVLGMKYKFKSQRLIERKRIEFLENNLTEYGRNLFRQENKIKEQENKLVSQNNEIKILNKQNEIKNGEISELSGKIDSMANQIQSQISEIQDLTIKNTENITLIESQNDKINSMDKIIETQAEQIENANSTLADLNNKLRVKEKELEQNKREISNLRNVINNQKRENEYKLCKYMTPEKYPEYLKDWYKRVTGETLNLNNPQTFNEKIQWLKLYDSTPLKTRLADKYLVREWVKEKIGEEYLIPLLGVWDNFDDINFDELPDKFVLKCNHGSGYNIIVTDKSKLDIEDTRKKINNWMNEDFAYCNGLELHYHEIKHKIIAEQYLDEISNALYDYRIFCSYGECVQIWLDIYSGTPNHKRKIYDRDWNELDIRVKWAKLEDYVEKPSKLAEMIQMAEYMSKEFSLVRVDFYFVEDKIYFGEMTFTSMSGTGNFEPEIAGIELGEKIKLPSCQSELTCV